MAQSQDFSKDVEFTRLETPLEDMTFNDVVDTINTIIARETSDVGGYKGLNESDVINYTIKTSIRQATQREKNKAVNAAVKQLMRDNPNLIKEAMAKLADEEE